MKRYIRDNQETILAGVSLTQGKLKFDWKSDDSEDDIVLLKENVSGEFNEDGVQYVYAYQYNPASSQRERSIFRNYLKNAPSSEDKHSENFENFIRHGVEQLDSYKPFKDFKVTITTHSSHKPSLTDEMLTYFMEYLDKNKWVPFELLKETYDHVTFDAKGAYQALIDAGYGKFEANQAIQKCKSKFESLKEAKEIFQMKRFLPREIRSGFHDFLKFKNDEERKTYESLQGVDVLIYDDFLTSGSTVKEIIRYLRSFHDKNTLTVFVLVKQ